MSSQSLFLDDQLDFGPEKTAGSTTRMSDNSALWPQEILGEAYKRLPFLGNFEVNVELDKIDEERGYGFGSLEVRTVTDLPAEDRRKKLRMIHIPILIKEQILQPLDVFVHGKRYGHLTEARLRAVLFRPDAFDSSQDVPPDMPFGQDLMPPAQGMHYGAGIKMGAAIGATAALNKGGANPGNLTSTPPPPPPLQTQMSGSTSSLPATSANQAAVPPPAPSLSQFSAGESLPAKTAEIIPILPQLNGRVLPQHIERIKTAMASISLRASFANASDGVQAALFSAMQLDPINLQKTADALKDSIRPDVVQIRRLDNGNYLVKWAAAAPFAPQQEQVPPQEAAQLMGQQDPNAQPPVGPDGTATMTPQMPAELAEDDVEVRPVDQFGLWKVEDTAGNQMIGWVFPRINSFDGGATPAMLFTNGSQHSIQEAIAGKMMGKVADLPKSQPQGYGALFSSKDGSAKVYSPMKITSTFRDPQGMVNYLAQTDDGQQVTFYFSDAVKDIVPVAPGQVIVPSGCGWLSLRSPTELVSDPSMFTKTATAVKKYTSTAELIGDGDVFSFRGPAVTKLASEFKNFIDKPQTEFIGGLLGIPTNLMKTAMARAAAGQNVAFRNLRIIVPAQEKMAEARAMVKNELQNLPHPIRNYFLLKEASILDDALTADKILGLGFINAENIATFVDMLPGLEDAQSKLAELLLAVRLGVREVSETAVERMLAALEDVINGLRTLKQKELHHGE